jgi:Ubiquitin-activating enzyme E1 FCCH domain
VAQKFNDNGSGVTGDMKAVIKAILLDYEARSSSLLNQQGYGKQREPVVRIAGIARAFPAPQAIPGTYSQSGNLITVSVSPPLTVSNGNNVYLDFSEASPGDADDAAYSVINPTTVGNVTTFNVRPKSTELTVNYTQTSASLVINVPDEHAFLADSNVYLDFTSVLPANAAQPADGLFAVTSSYELNQDSDDYFTVPAPLARRGTYSQPNGSSTITVTVSGGHSYMAGDSVQIDFVTGGAASGTFTVVGSTSPTLTVTGTDIPTSNRTGNANLILPDDIVTRNGALVATRGDYSVNRTVALTFSDWGINDTDNDLSQTPMRSPTVFNFYEPDYRYPGSLAQAGLITPEFQITSDTTVIRQANFIYNGIFNDLHGIRGLSSFNNGGRDIALDFRPWMGEGPGGLPWLHNNNLGAFVDKMNLLLMAGQLPSTGTNNYTTSPRTIVNAKSVITDYAQSLPYDKTVTNVTTAALTTVTVTAHGYSTGNQVTIAGVTGFTAINGTHTITVTGPNTFTVPVTCTTTTAVLTSANATVSGVSKSITGLSGFCSVSLTNHGFATGQPITLFGVAGGAFTPAINGSHIVINDGNTNSFLVPVTRTSSSGQSNTNARVSIVGGFPDLIRDRIRAIVHLMVTSPDFTIQK